MASEEKALRAFTAHGFEPAGKTGNQRFGDCPFCARENKFYVNEENGLWDCKVCGKKGNAPQFLEKISELNVKRIGKEEFRVLARDRGLPTDALRGIELGYHDGHFTFPVRDLGNRLQDLRIYKPGTRLMGTAGCKTGLWNAHSILGTPKSMPIYLCEGEWDGIAMSWLARKLDKKVIVVAVPGANTFKKEWAELFQERKVYCLYDHDEAGEEGQLTVQERLTGIAQSVEYIHWPDILPAGFDIRDLIVRRAVKRDKPASCWDKIHRMLKPLPTRNKEAVILGKKGAEHRKEDRVEERAKPIKFAEVLATIRKWLYLNSTDGIEVAAASMLSNKLGGDPLWMFIVATPGGAKTEILSTLQKCPESYFTSSLTPHSLISGASWTNGSDPSLIPKLDQKVLIIKDFTTILTKRDQEKDEIFGILRDAYDGNCSKVFGTGVKRSYISKFSILSAVTPKIYELAETHQSLGERFLKFCIGENLEHDSEHEIIDRAIRNLQQEDEMRGEMSDKMAQFVAWKYQCMADGMKQPVIPANIMQKLVSLAQYGARMRGIVARDKYRPEIVNAAPSSEIGSRLGKQLAKLAIALAIVNDRDTVNENDYRLVKKTMLDTISQKTERVVREMFRMIPKAGETVTTKMVSRETRFPQTTISRLLSDLDLLKIVERKGNANKYEWGISDYVRGLIAKADLYTTPEEMNRPTAGKSEPVKKRLTIRRKK